MTTKRPSPEPGEPFSLLDPRVMDPEGEIVSHESLDEADLDQVVRVMEALRRWRATERRMSEASRRYMKLGETDMRALRYIIAAQRNAQLATPSDLARHLGVSTASVTKLLDRLAAQDHIRRLPHPADRRSTAIEVTEETHRTARESIGRSHAGRFHAAADLTAEEREVVIRFLDALSATEPPPQP
ncbi:MarR family winged helix-turn-helix transcriptional regulator [Nesterenkonia sp. HG001]|uniref:MarR family winged helix-turn-helix transcriptional regulator n=1 Tax=Nesterenkonia sp. HG001 TaxID=2983207 RepID=UPI002AC48688|nr:MarR family transcriptional regulator [Nesterenkonia sp. HG001]MDZ5078892.1 MarR family transcriptional regulator [Nesterenkonia sp. HG001]